MDRHISMLHSYITVHTNGYAHQQIHMLKYLPIALLISTALLEAEKLLVVLLIQIGLACKWVQDKSCERRHLGNAHAVNG